MTTQLTSQMTRQRVVVLFTIFDRVTGEIFTVIDRDFQGPAC